MHTAGGTVTKEEPVKLPGAAAVMIFCVALAGCASGPRFGNVERKLAALPQGMARIYIYRTGLFGAAVRPDVYLNGHRIGDCVPNEVFYQDVWPGRFEAVAVTTTERRLTFSIAAGETRFVKCSVGIGFLFGQGQLELVDPTQAERAIQDLEFVEP